MSEVVRVELEKLIIRKQRKVNSLKKEEDAARQEGKRLASERKELEVEVGEFTAHLDELGGPVVAEDKE